MKKDGVNFPKFLDVPLIDCHFHFWNMEAAHIVLEITEKAGYRKVNLLSNISDRVNYNAEDIYMKAAYAGQFYAYGGLDYSAIYMNSKYVERNLTRQVDNLIKIGFDGIKMWEGKPFVRKVIKIPFDSDFYREYFEYVESIQLPILFHVNDPEEFWDSKMTPVWAKERGYQYDMTYPAKEDLYTEIGNVLERCPYLKVIFAHFYFLSADLERASRLLEDYRNVHLDITPGFEMYPNFSARREDWREFFIRYQDRILFGTDLNDVRVLSSEKAVERVNFVRGFIETDTPLHWETSSSKEASLVGLNLPKHVVRKIYSENFERITGKEPRELNIDAAIEECQRLAKTVAKLRGIAFSYPLPSWLRLRKEKNPAEHIAYLLKEIRLSRPAE